MSQCFSVSRTVTGQNFKGNFRNPWTVYLISAAGRASIIHPLADICSLGYPGSYFFILVGKILVFRSKLGSAYIPILSIGQVYSYRRRSRLVFVVLLQNLEGYKVRLVVKQVQPSLTLPEHLNSHVYLAQYYYSLISLITYYQAITHLILKSQKGISRTH